MLPPNHILYRWLTLWFVDEYITTTVIRFLYTTFYPSERKCSTHISPVNSLYFDCLTGTSIKVSADTAGILLYLSLKVNVLLDLDHFTAKLLSSTGRTVVFFTKAWNLCFVYKAVTARVKRKHIFRTRKYRHNHVRIKFRERNGTMIVTENAVDW